MHMPALALALVAAATSAAHATTPQPSHSAPRLVDVAAYMEARYAGEVAAIEFDAAGDKSDHFHVTMRYPESGHAYVDVDAATLAIEAHEHERFAGDDRLVANALSVVAANLPGEPVRATLDATRGAPPHADIDLRLPGGAIARLKVLAGTQEIVWRTPGIVAP